MKTTKQLLVIAGAAVMCCATASAALVAQTLDLTFVSTGSTAGGFGSNGGNIIADTFTYDALNLTATPDQTGSGPAGVAVSYQPVTGLSVDTAFTLNYDIATYTVAEPIGWLYVDMWTTSNATTYPDITFTFFDSSDVELADVTMTLADASTSRYVRGIISGLEQGDTVSRLAITTTAQSGWGISEIRVAGVVPEPTSTSLLGLGALALVVRRKR